MKNRVRFLLDGTPVGEKDLKNAPKVGDKETVKSKPYEIVTVTPTGKNEYDVEVKLA